MNTKERLELIKRNLQEIIGEEELDEKIKSKKEFSIYWGTMPTGSISIAYFFPMLKVADFLLAGCKVKILIADLHALLDGVPEDILGKRYKYYKYVILKILKVLNGESKNLEFVRGSSFQLDKNYFHDLLKLSTFTSLRNSRKAASEVVKSAKGENVLLSGMIYPLMQALDEEYLKVDAQLGGVDQRKIMVYAREYLPKIGYQSRIEMMNPMVRGLVGKQMSSSIEGTKIDLLDDETTVKKKILKAECEEGNPDNGVLSLIKYLVFGIKNEFVVFRPEKFGGSLKYSNYTDLEDDFSKKKIHPLDLKNSLIQEINELLLPFREDKELRRLWEEAYKKNP